MARVPEYDTEKVAWNSSDNGGAIARKSGAKTYSTSHQHLNQFL
jgi:hypothetical protein